MADNKKKERGRTTAYDLLKIGLVAGVIGLGGYVTYEVIQSLKWGEKQKAELFEMYFEELDLLLEFYHDKIPNGEFTEAEQAYEEALTMGLEHKLIMIDSINHTWFTELIDETEDFLKFIGLYIVLGYIALKVIPTIARGVKRRWPLWKRQGPPKPGTGPIDPVHAVPPSDFPKFGAGGQTFDSYYAWEQFINSHAVNTYAPDLNRLNQAYNALPWEVRSWVAVQSGYPEVNAVPWTYIAVGTLFAIGAAISIVVTAGSIAYPVGAAAPEVYSLRATLPFKFWQPLEAVCWGDGGAGLLVAVI